MWGVEIFRENGKCEEITEASKDGTKDDYEKELKTEDWGKKVWGDKKEGLEREMEKKKKNKEDEVKWKIPNIKRKGGKENWREGMERIERHDEG